MKIIHFFMNSPVLTGALIPLFGFGLILLMAADNPNPDIGTVIALIAGGFSYIALGFCAGTLTARIALNYGANSTPTNFAYMVLGVMVLGPIYVLTLFISIPSFLWAISYLKLRLATTPPTPPMDIVPQHRLATSSRNHIWLNIAVIAGLIIIAFLVSTLVL